MVDVKKDSDAPQRIPIKPNPNPGPGAVDLDEEAAIGASRAKVREQLDQFKNLPANKLPETNINFLGSSYSGVDIKVVAHLYDGVNLKDEKTNDLQARKLTADTVVDGCNNLLNGGLLGLADDAADNVITYDERRAIFLQAAGLTESDDTRAVGIMISNVFNVGSFSFLAVERMRRVSLQLRDQYKASSDNIDAELANLESIEFNSSNTVTLGTLQTLSVQTHREKFAVRALGHSYAKAYTRGTRTIAGSMIFTIFNEHALSAMIRAMAESSFYGERDSDLATLLPDQLPPIDLTIVFANEYGSLSDFRLYGVEFVNDGSTFSIEDLLSEQIMNFVCRDADVMTSRGKIRLSRLQRGMFNGKDDKDITGSSLLFNNENYNGYLDRLGIRRRLKNR